MASQGVGKRLVTKHILNQFDELENAVSIYLNTSALTPNLALKEIKEKVEVKPAEEEEELTTLELCEID